MLKIWLQCFKNVREIEYLDLSNFNYYNVVGVEKLFNCCHK